MVDDMGINELGCYGQDLIKTPSIDKMAEEGMMFSRHYSGTSVCAPTRDILMTGLHSGHSYIRANWEFDGYQQPIPDSSYTVAEMFKEAGYVTGCIGKWGLGGPDTDGHPNNQGFDFFYGYLGQVQAHEYYPDYLWRNSEKEYLSNEYSHDLMMAEARDFVDRNRDSPFFLYLPLTIPHAKLQVPDLNIYADSTGDWTYNRKAHASMITRMDKDVGDLLLLLESYGIDSTTLVIFTSDNGAKENTEILSFFDGNGLFRGAKRDLYEGGIRVPHIAWWPGTVEAGSESGHISAFWDLLPTCAEIAGHEPPARTDGISYLSELKGEIQETHDHLYFEIHEGGSKKSQAVVMDNWKAVRPGMNSGMDVPVELFNLETDISESTNLASEFPGIAMKLEYLMLKDRTAHSHFNFGHPPYIELEDIGLRRLNNTSLIGTGDTLQLGVEFYPSNSFYREFVIKTEALTDGVQGHVNRYGELIVNEVPGFLSVIVISTRDENISDTLRLEVTDDPIVYTMSLNYLNSSSISVSGKIVNDDDELVKSRGFAWSRNEMPTVYDSLILSVDESSLFSANIEGLKSNTDYYVRAVAMTEEETIYGGQMTAVISCVGMPYLVRSMVFYYPFEDDFNDRSGKGNDPDHINGPPEFSEQSVYGRSIWLNGIDNSIVTPSGLLNPAKDNFTLCGWIYPVNADQNRMIFQQESLEGTGRSILYLSGDKIQSYLGGGAHGASQSINMNQWTHVALVCNPLEKSIQFYINGTEEPPITGINIESTIGEIYLGRHKAGNESNKWVGYMDEMMLFDTLLGNFDIIDIMNTFMADTVPDMNENFIISARFNNDIAGEINNQDNTIQFELSDQQDITNVYSEIEVSEGAHVYPLTGSYLDFSSEVEFFVTAPNQEIRSYTANCILVSAMGIDDPMDRILIYPNPVKDMLEIEIPEELADKGLEYSLNNMLGGNVLSGKVNKGTNKIYLPADISSGNYIISISSKAHEQFRKNLIVL